MKIQLSNKEVEIADKWQDLTLKQYLQYAQAVNDIDKQDDLDKTLSVIRICEIFLNMEEGGLDDYPMQDTNLLIKSINDLLININTAVVELESDRLEVDGIIYKLRNINELDSISTGESISIEVIKKKYANDYIGMATHLLAIIIRPAMLMTNNETGDTYLQMDLFNKNDIMNLEYRADLFRDIKAGYLVPVLNFFLNGRK